MKIIHSITIFFISYLLITVEAMGQRWIQHTNVRGLSPNEKIHSIHEDNDGNIWLATNTGLKKASLENKLNQSPTFWESFNKEDGLIDNEVNTIASDLNGHLWIGTAGGVSWINPLTDLRNPANWDNYTVANTDSGLRHNNVETITIDANGNIWFGTSGWWISIALATEKATGPGSKVYHDPTAWWQLSNRDSLPHPDIWSIVVDGTGAIWVGTGRGTVRYERVDRNGVKGIKVFNDIKDARSIFNDNKGYVWFGTVGNGVWCVHQDSVESIKNFKPYPIIGKEYYSYVKAIAQDQDGNMWFGNPSDEGAPLSMIDPKTDLNIRENWVDFNVEHGLSGTCIYSLLKDRHGYMWVGSEAYGLTQFDDTWVTIFAKDNNPKAGLTDNTFKVLTIDNQNHLWLGTENGDLCRFHLKDNPLAQNNWQWFKNPDTVNISNTIRSLFQDSQDYLWVGTQYRVFRVDPNSDLTDTSNWLNFKWINGNNDTMVRSISEDQKGYIWLGTNHGLWRTHNDSLKKNKTPHWCESYHVKDGLVNNYVNCLLSAQDGDLWIGTEQGINRIDINSDLRDTNNWKQYTTEEGLVSNRVQTMLQDSTGKIWFGTSDGVSCVDPELDLRQKVNWNTFTMANGLPSNHINAMIQPHKNEIWFATDGGMGKLDFASRKDWTVYTSGDGIGANTILSLATDALKDDIWIGTRAGGITRYRAKKRAPETFLNNTFDIVTEDIITYEFVGSDLTTPTYDLLYSYCFSDSNNGNAKARWSTFSSATTATLVIPHTDRPARYIFKVTAMDKEGNIDATPATDIFWKIAEPMGGWTLMELNQDTVKIYLPPKTYSGQALLINQIPSYQLPDAASVVLAFEISIPHIDSLNKPATMQIILKNRNELEETNLAIFKLNESSSWIGIGGTVAIESDSTISITTSFTEVATYAIRREKLIAAALYSNKIHVQPRLFSPHGAGQGHGDRVTISFMLQEDSPVSVKIYNLAGRMKKKLKENKLLKGTNAIEWDGRDDDGNFCPTGLYIVTVEAEGHVKKKTVMVSNKY